MTATVEVSSGASETVTWTQTSYSSPYGDLIAAFDEGETSAESGKRQKAIETSSKSATAQATESSGSINLLVSVWTGLASVIAGALLVTAQM